MPVPPGSTIARKPTALKALDGTLNRSLSNPDEPQGTPGVPEAPQHLDQEERAAWTRFAEILGPLKVCTRQDFAAFESLVTAWVQAQRLRAELRADAERGDARLTYDTEKMTRVKPALQALNEVDRRLQGWCGRFGLSPADRGRVSSIGGAPSGNDPDSEFGG